MKCIIESKGKENEELTSVVESGMDGVASLQ